MKRLTPLFLLFFAPVFADHSQEMYSSSKENTHCTEQKCGATNALCPPPQTAAYNAPVLLGLDDSWDVSFNGSFVYYQAIEENLNYISSTTSTLNQLGSGETHESAFGDVDFDYKPGFTVGLAGTFGCDEWTVSLDYFRFHAQPSSNRFSQTVVANPDSDYQANLFWSATDDGHDADEFDTALDQGMHVTASSRWNLDIDMIDASLGRTFFVGQRLLFHPFVGLRGGWIDQKYDVNYVGENTTTSLLFTHASTNSTDSSAIGFRGGLDTTWNCCWGLFLFGDMHGSILYTRYKNIRSNQTMSETETGTGDLVRTDIYTSPSRSMNVLRPQADMSMGLGWADTLYDTVYLDLRASWDMQVFWEQNVFQKFYDNSQDPTAFKGNLYLQGLSVSAQLSF